MIVKFQSAFDVAFAFALRGIENTAEALFAFFFEVDILALRGVGCIVGRNIRRDEFAVKNDEIRGRAKTDSATCRYLRKTGDTFARRVGDRLRYTAKRLGKAMERKRRVLYA